jgi:hypothetical protein
VEDARRVGQEPAPELLPLPVGSHKRTFRRASHDTGTRGPSSCNALTSCGPRPFPEGRRPAGKEEAGQAVARSFAGWGAAQPGVGVWVSGKWAELVVFPPALFLPEEALVDEQAGKKVSDVPLESQLNAGIPFPSSLKTGKILSNFIYCGIRVLNSGLRVCQAGGVLLEPHLQSILLWLFWRWRGVGGVS